MYEYLLRVDWEKLQEYLRAGLTLQFCYENDLAIKVTMDKCEYKIIYT